jgi:hypothetical protein
MDRKVLPSRLKEATGASAGPLQFSYLNRWPVVQNEMVFGMNNKLLLKHTADEHLQQP